MLRGSESLPCGIEWKMIARDSKGQQAYRSPMALKTKPILPVMRCSKPQQEIPHSSGVKKQIAAVQQTIVNSTQEGADASFFGYWQGDRASLADRVGVRVFVWFEYPEQVAAGHQTH